MPQAGQISMPSMSIAEVFDFFERLARSCGLRVESEPHSTAFGKRLTRALRGSDELRLVWDGRDELLSLEVSHGPSAGPRAGWHVLCSAPCPGAVLVDVADGPSCMTCIEYGCELMLPGGAHSEA